MMEGFVGAHHQYDGTDQIDCPQRVCPNPSAHKDRVNNGEQEEADIAAYRRDHIPGHSSKLWVVHLITSSPAPFRRASCLTRFLDDDRMKPSYTRRVSTMKKENLLSIGALSKQTGVHIKSLRYYDSLGILRPCLR